MTLLWYNEDMKYTVFKEHQEFSKKKPWEYKIHTFPTDRVVPPHYAETLEVLIYENITGETHIGGHRLKLGGKQVFFVGPNVVHAMYYKKNDGKNITLKIDTELLKPIFDISAYLDYYGTNFSNLPMEIFEFDEIIEISEVFLNGEICDVIPAIIRLFSILISHSDDYRHFSFPQSNDMLAIISWTEENFSKKITLEEVAKQVGYSKHYLCRKFKNETGTTYLSYLNFLRISNACKFLKAGQPIPVVSENCGFEDISYFTQLFKKIVGVTPKKYTQFH